MKFNFNKFSLKKFISVFAAIAVLMTSLPMSAFFTTVGAAGNSSIIDFEGKDASAIVEGNDAFSITGQDSEDKYYFLAKNNTADALTLTFDDIVLENGKQYTLDFDVYTLRVSKDESDVLLGLKMYGDSETLFEKQIKNTDICEENWANYHTTFTAKDGVNKLDFSIYTIGKVFIDNLVIIDENGNETAIDTAAACEATELKDHFSMATLYDIAYEEPDIIDGYLKAAVPVNSNITHNEGVDIPMNLTKPLDKGRYTVTVDLKFTSVGSCRDAFCASVAGADYGIIQQKWLNAVDITLNKYKTYTFELDLTPEHTYFRLNVYQGCTAYIDNLALIDPAGIEVVRFDFDEPVNFKGSAYEQKGIAKTKAASAALYSRLLASTRAASDDYAILVDASNVAAGSYGQLYLHEVGMPYDNTYAAGDYTIKFDFYALEIGSSKNIVAHLTKPDWSGDAFPGNGQKWTEISETIGEWQTISFDITTVADGKFPWFYIGAGMKGYFDNYQIIDKSTGETVLDFSPVEADLGKTSKDICTVVALPKDDEDTASDDYAILVDASNVAAGGYGQLYLHEVGMPYSAVYPAGDYTIKFDFYALEIGSSKNIVAHLTKPDWSGDAFPGNGQKWTEISETIGEWQTISFDITTVADGKFPWFYIGAGMKGYFDNYQIIDKSTGETVLDFSPVEADLGKTSKDICTVVALPKDEDDDAEASTNDVLLVDTTAEGNGTPKDFWFNELGMTGYGDLPNGTYTIQFDVYPFTMPTGGNLFHFRTGNGRAASSDTGWWKPDLALEQWTTTSSTFTVTDATTTGNHILYVYGGFKGYVDNLVILDASGKEVAGTRTDITGLTVPEKHKDYLEIVTLTSSSEEVETNDVLLIDTTTVTDDGSDNRNFWFNELGMAGYGDLPNGTYTIQFDVCALKMPESKNLFHFRTSKGSGSSKAGFWKPDLTIGEWATTSSTFTVTDDTTSGNHILYVYGGFKGYVDNLVILDASGKEVAGTRTDITGLTVPANDRVDYSPYLEIVTLTSSSEEVETNDVLLVDTTTVTDDGSDNRNFWFNELGMAGYGDLPNGTYTIQFDVCALKMPESKNLFHFRTSKGSGSSKAGFWKPDLTIGEWATTSSTFTVTDDTTSGNHILYVYGGFKGYVDNLVILDASGKEVAGTRTDITGLTVPANDRVDYSPYLEIVTLTSSSEGEETNYGVLVDNSAGTGYDSFWMTSLGLPVQSLPSGEKYTIEFDWYSESIGSPNNGSIRVWEGHMSGSNAIVENDSIWFDLPSETGSWTTISKEVTASSNIGAVYIYVGAGVKGYLDNFKIIGSDGTVHVNIEFTADDLNKTINCATVVALPKDVTGDSDDSDDNDDVLSSGMNIAILRGRAGKNGASIKLGGVKSPLSISSNKTYKLTFDYYQANPTDSGILNLFGVDTGFDNEITYFKKNNTTGWTTVNVFFETGDITNANADWFEIILSPNAWVYFDNFKVAEQAVDNNKEVSVIDFEQKDDSIYPDLVADNCTFGQTTEFSGTSNGGNGYFCASNAREYTNDDKNSNQQYQFGGIKLKSNTTYRVSIDYYVAKPINDYAFAIGYSQKDVGSGSGDSWQIWGNNKLNVGWNTESFVLTTGEVVPNGKFLKLVIYDTPDSSNPRVMYFDNITFTELYRIDSSSNNSDLGTVSSTRTVEAGSDSKVVANPYAGVTFEGWYEYGDLVSTDETYRIKDVRDNHKLVAHFSGSPVKPDHIVQGFEDYDLGDILYEYYEIVDDPNNVLEGKQSLHVKPDKIEVNADHSVFFPLVSNVEAQLKEDTEYDVYIWVKPTKPAESTTYFQIVDATGVVDMSDLLTSPGGTGMQLGLKPLAATALEEKDGFYKYLVGTITKDVASRQGLGIQVCKFHAFRMEGASIDDLYVDMVEVVECVPDYANLKFTENLFNEISNSNFEDAVTNDNRAPLTDGVSIVDVTDKEYDWQGNKQMVFDAAASNGQEYIRVIPVAKTNKNYTFAAWTKLSAGSDITVGLYKNGNYETFENVVNGASGKLGLIDDGKWNRVSFTFNSGDSENAYLVIKGTKGTLELDMVELFIATRAYTTDPNSYGLKAPVFQMTNPIAFPDIIKTETTYIDSDDDEDDDFDDSYITSDDEDDDTDDDEKTEETKKKKKKKRVVKVVKNGGTSPWVWVGVGAGALVVAAAVTIFVILFKKRKQTKKGAK